MKYSFLLRGRDVTTLLFALWAAVFAYVGYHTVIDGGALLPVVLYGDLQAVSMRFGVPYVLAYFGFHSQGHVIGLSELAFAGLLILGTFQYVATRQPDFTCDRLHAIFALVPIGAVPAALVAVHDLGREQASPWFVPCALALAAVLSLFVTPALLASWGIPCDRRRTGSARPAPIVMSNWNAARR